MGGRSPAVYFPNGQGRRAATLQQAASCRNIGLALQQTALKIPTVLCSDLPGPGRLAGMGGRSPPVHLPGGHGRGTATFSSGRLSQTLACATTVLIAIKFLLFLFRSPRAWTAGRNGWTVTAGTSSRRTWTRRCNIKAGPYLAADIGFALEQS
jgi:hypothetical protein